MDEIARAYSLLNSMKQNVPTAHNISESWVNDFHAALDKVEKATGLSLQEFRIPSEELRKETTGGNYLTGEVSYSGRLVVERTRFLMKVDAVLGYFQFQTGSAPRGGIGFSKP